MLQYAIVAIFGVFFPISKWKIIHFDDRNWCWLYLIPLSCLIWVNRWIRIVLSLSFYSKWCFCFGFLFSVTLEQNIWFHFISLSTQQQKKRNYKIQNPRSLQQDNKASMYIICGIFFICTAWRVLTVKTEKKIKSRFKHHIFLVSVCAVCPRHMCICVHFSDGSFLSLANKQIHINRQASVMTAWF